MESLVSILQHDLFVVVDVEVFEGAVAAFTAAAAYGHDGQVVVLCGKHVGVLAQLRFFHPRTREERVGAQVAHLGLGFEQGKLLVFLIDAAQGVVDHESRILQTFHQVYHVRFVHVARTCSAAIQIIRGDAEEGRLLSACQRQRLVLVFQQHHSLGGSLAGQLGMCLNVGFVGVFVTLEVGCLHHVFQYSAHVAVYVFHLDGAVLCTLDDVLYLFGVARSEQVVAGSHLSVGMASAGPVGHHDTLESPFVAQDGGEQFFVLLCPRTVQEVI